MKSLLDTNIFIDFLKGVEKAKSYFETLSPDSAYYSAITLTEILAGTSPGDEDPTEIFLNLFQCIDVNPQIARQAAGYIRKFGKSFGLKVPDALIAATAWWLKGRLVTRNVRHFPMRDIEINVPF